VVRVFEQRERPAQMSLLPTGLLAAPLPKLLGLGFVGASLEGGLLELRLFLASRSSSWWTRALKASMLCERLWRKAKVASKPLS
jgi:hypothetical protein